MEQLPAEREAEDRDSNGHGGTALGWAGTLQSAGQAPAPGPTASKSDNPLSSTGPPVPVTVGL